MNVRHGMTNAVSGVNEKRNARRPELGGKSSRDKGLRVEREIVNELKGLGVDAERVPLSGAAGGSFSGDITISKDDPIGKLVAEVKARKNGSGFRTIEKWMGDNDLIFLKKNNQKPMVIMNWELFSKFIAGS
jgi:Holliday junction resolvase